MIHHIAGGKLVRMSFSGNTFSPDIEDTALRRKTLLVSLTSQLTLTEGLAAASKSVT